jgi:hypothetical protein
MLQDGVFTQARFKVHVLNKIELGFGPLAKEIDLACPTER